MRILSANERHAALQFSLLAECNKARVARVRLPHVQYESPIFMPVGTQGTVKGVFSEQLQRLDPGPPVILGNTYHLGQRPGPDRMAEMGGLHAFEGWPRGILTDSGGFQMVSLLALAEITEEGVQFQSPHDGTASLLTPEESMRIQNCIGGDIMMVLDDVVATTTTGPRVEEAMHRTIRWADRCKAAHSRPADQNLFAIVQGGLDLNLRKTCLEALVERDFPGYAIGGLSGGESKDDFWRVVHFCTSRLPRDRPRYVMGVGYPEDLVVCVALGADMFDCVFPTRTARFGSAFTWKGLLNLKHKSCSTQVGQPIDPLCKCETCRRYSRAYLHVVAGRDAAGCSLVSIHNVSFLMQLMEKMRLAIRGGHKDFHAFVEQFFEGYFSASASVPRWIQEALDTAGFPLSSSTPSPPILSTTTASST